MFETFKRFAKTVVAIFPYLWKQGMQAKALTVTSMLTALASIGLKSVGPIFLSQAINQMGNNNTQTNSGTIYTDLTLYTTTAIMGEVLGALSRLCLGKIAGEASRQIELTVAAHINQLPMDFHTQKNTAVVARAFSGNHTAMYLFINGVSVIIPLLLQTLVVAGIVFAVGWAEGLLLLGSVGGFLVLLTVGSTKSAVAIENEYVSVYAAADKINENLFYNEVVRATNNTDFELVQFGRFLTGRARLYFTSVKTYLFFATSSSLVVELGFLGIVLVAGSQVIANQVNVANFVLVVTLVGLIVPALSQIGSVGQELVNGMIGINELMNYLHYQREPSDVHLPALVFNDSSIQFNHVSFRYQDQDEFILRDITFEIPLGKKVAIVGRSGQGKSTIVKLLMRFFEVSEGSICINGQDIRGFTRDSLRAGIAIVPQDTPIFNNTLHYNITYSNHNVSDEEFQQVLKDSCLYDWVQSLPEKEQTMTGERGLKISGGEKQRIAIARALLRRPAIYVFDEATSSLDNKTERSIQHVIDSVTQGVTSLTIAHRLTTVKNADEIIVFNNHTIVERGTHDYLIASRGEYFQMWQQQHQKPMNYSMPVMRQQVFRGQLPYNQLPTYLKAEIDDLGKNANVFSVLRISREELVRRLLSLTADLSARSFLWNEIYAALIANRLERSLEFNALYKGFFSSALSDAERDEALQRVTAFCSRPLIFTSYINSYLGDMSPGYNTVLLFARLSNLTIYLWQKTYPDNTVELINSNVDQNPSQIIHILIGEDYIHYDFLVETLQPETDDSLAPEVTYARFPVVAVVARQHSQRFFSRASEPLIACDDFSEWDRSSSMLTNNTK